MRWTKIKFQNKILILFICSVLILTFGMLIYFSVYVARTEKENSGGLLDAFCRTITHSLDEMLVSMDLTALQIAYNPDVVNNFVKISQLQDNTYFEKNLFAAKELSELISSYNFARNVSLRTCLISEKGDFLSVGTKSVQTDELKRFFATEEVAGWKAHFAQGNHPKFIPPQEDPYSNQVYGTATQETFSVVRPVRNSVTPSLQSIYGFVEIQKGIQALDSLFASLPPNSGAFILDDQGVPFLQYNCEEGFLLKDSFSVSNVYANWNKGLTKQESYFLHNSGYIVTIRQISDFGLTIMLVQDYEANRIFSFWRVAVFIIIVIVLAFCVMQWFAVHHLTKPLKTLHSSITSISSQNTTLQTSGNDDLAEIEMAYNQMLARLQSSMLEQVESRTREVKSFLMALQAQMNPHFIHNILSIISMEAEEEKYEEISEICCQLSEMLRFTVSYDETSNTLEQELAYTENYLSLMKIRYEEMLNYTINTRECEFPIAKASVPHLILQPLVENCFKHAFSDARPPWNIEISFKTNQDIWQVSVSDNGIGFDPAYLQDFETLKCNFSIDDVEEILSQLHVGGLCISNIFVRLKIIYKDTLIFTIKEKDGGGTVITIGGSFNA